MTADETSAHALYFAGHPDNTLKRPVREHGGVPVLVGADTILTAGGDEPVLAEVRFNLAVHECALRHNPAILPFPHHVQISGRVTA